MGNRSVFTNKIFKGFSVQFWLLAAFVVCVFFLGGASRLDVQSLAVLRPLSVVVCGIALLTLRPAHLAGRTWLWAGFAVILVLALAHLLPMPVGVQLFSGRSLTGEINAAAGLGDIWRPLAQVPINGWGAFLTLFAPLAVLLLGIQLRRDDLYRLLPVLIAIGSFSGLLGVLQAVGNPQGPLYFYRITNNGFAVGLFANRNHAAVLLACLLPMLAIFASTTGSADSERRAAKLASLAIAIVIIPLILVTGSRSGFLLALFGLLGAAVLYRPVAERAMNKRMPAGGMGKNRRYAFVGAGAVSLGLLTIFFSRANALDRLFAASAAEHDRLGFWSASVDMFWTFFPLGAGSASFAESFQIGQPMFLQNANYLNRAHNDWLETLTNFGLVGAVLLVAATVILLRKSYILWRRYDGSRRSVNMARMAAVVLTMIAIASFGDYPLRTPSLMCFTMIVLLWLAEPESDRPRRENSRANGQVGAA